MELHPKRKVLQDIVGSLTRESVTNRTQVMDPKPIAQDPKHCPIACTINQELRNRGFNQEDFDVRVGTASIVATILNPTAPNMREYFDLSEELKDFICDYDDFLLDVEFYHPDMHPCWERAAARRDIPDEY